MTYLLAIIAFIQRGGPVNWVIVGLYLLVLYGICERTVYFLHHPCKEGKKEAPFHRFLGEKATPSMWPASFRRSPAGEVATAVWNHQDAPAPILLERIDREVVRLRDEMERWLNVFSFVVTVAPLLGLLGTVTGLMRAFHVIEMQGGMVDVAQLSSGIWEAMITTATGLGTAILAAIAARFFEVQVDKRLRHMALVISYVLEFLRPDCLGKNLSSFGEALSESVFSAGSFGYTTQASAGSHLTEVSEKGV